MNVIYSNLEATFDEQNCRLRWDEMSPVRGIMMLIAAGFAFYQGWRMPPGRHAILAFGLGTLALGLAVWHLAQTRKSSRNSRL